MGEDENCGLGGEGPIAQKLMFPHLHRNVTCSVLFLTSMLMRPLLREN